MKIHCAWCESNADAESVDIGVGMQQVDAARCDECGAVQMAGYGEDKANATAEENRRRWWMGEETEWFMIHVLDTDKWFNTREWVEHLFGFVEWDPRAWTLQTRVCVSDFHGVVHDTYVTYDPENTRVFRGRCGQKLRVAGSGAMVEPTCVACVGRL
jgi:hypothetical protein